MIGFTKKYKLKIVFQEKEITCLQKYLLHKEEFYRSRVATLVEDKAKIENNLYTEKERNKEIKTVFEDESLTEYGKLSVIKRILGRDTLHWTAQDLREMNNIRLNNQKV